MVVVHHHQDLALVLGLGVVVVGPVLIRVLIQAVQGEIETVHLSETVHFNPHHTSLKIGVGKEVDITAGIQPQEGDGRYETNTEMVLKITLFSP